VANILTPKILASAPLSTLSIKVKINITIVIATRITLGMLCS